jgi:hypothetical protein
MEGKIDGHGLMDDHLSNLCTAGSVILEIANSNHNKWMININKWPKFFN